MFPPRFRHRYRRATSSLRKLPDYLIIGAQKGGTTTLIRALGAHPRVTNATAKEVHFFDLNFEKGLAWYRTHFPWRWKRCQAGESSPSYLFAPYVAARVRATLPDVRLIVLLRNPVDRAFSAYQMGRRNGIDQAATFEEALAREETILANEGGRNRDDPQAYSYEYHNLCYRARGLYSEQLGRWLDRFPREQLLILASESLFLQPERVLLQVEQFLGLPEWVPASLTPQNTGDYTSELAESTRQELERFYEPEVARLETLTGIRFDWFKRKRGGD